MEICSDSPDHLHHSSVSPEETTGTAGRTAQPQMSVKHFGFMIVQMKRPESTAGAVIKHRGRVCADTRTEELSSLHCASIQMAAETLKTTL